MEKIQNQEKKRGVLTLGDIRHFVADQYGNVEVVVEAENVLILETPDGRRIRISEEDQKNK